jgi:Ca2+-binding EF-hand superfamily protein
MMVATKPVGQKVERLFELMDTNGDGYVEWDDYQRVIDRFRDGYRLEPDSRKAQALEAAYRVWWLELQRHAGGVGPLAREDYVAATCAATADTSRVNLVDGLSHALFDIMDTDDDNLIDRDEFAHLLAVRELTSPDAIGVFDILDTDGDGRISRQEYLASWRHFFQEDTADTPDSWYFGKL